jgi:hypothetical protein
MQVEGTCHRPEVQQAHVALAALHGAHVGAMEPRSLRERLLTQAGCLTVTAERDAEGAQRCLLACAVGHGGSPGHCTLCVDRL